MTNQEIKRNLDLIESRIVKNIFDRQHFGLCTVMAEVIESKDYYVMKKFLNAYRPFSTYIYQWFFGYWWNATNQDKRLRYIQTIKTILDNPNNYWLKFKLKLGLF